jgi:hypothetical protein
MFGSEGGPAPGVTRDDLQGDTLNESSIYLLLPVVWLGSDPCFITRSLTPRRWFRLEGSKANATTPKATDSVALVSCIWWSVPGRKVRSQTRGESWKSQ